MSRSIKAGALAAHVLKSEGVQYLFGIPGGHIYPIMEECDALGIPFIGVRHEMTAAFAAEAWGLTTGNIGVCTATAGPGVTNLLTGMANSYMAKYPALYLGGKSMVVENDRNELQDVDQISVIKSMSKHARTVYEPLRVPEYVSRAISYAKNGVPGPAYIEIPKDIILSHVNFDEVEFQDNFCSNSRIKAEDKLIKEAIVMIKEAKRPVIIAGSGVWWSQGQEALKTFVEKSGIPFCTRNAARGCIPDSHDLYVSLGCNDPITINVVAQSDLVIVVGTRSSYTLSRAVITEKQKIIRIDIDPTEVTNQWDADLAIVGDAKAVLEQLADGVEEKSYPEWYGLIGMVKNEVKMGLASLCQNPQAVPIHPVSFFNEFVKFVDENTVVVLDGGDVATWGALFVPAYGPGQLIGIHTNSFGPLGLGMGYAIAAKLAHPEKNVILLVGDGAFGYSAMEFDTCMRYGINITAVIFNDALWGMIKRSEARKSPDREGYVGLDLRETHYEKVIEALGGYGELVTKPQDIGKAIERAIASNKPACVNVMVDPNIGPPK